MDGQFHCQATLADVDQGAGKCGVAGGDLNCDLLQFAQLGDITPGDTGKGPSPWGV